MKLKIICTGLLSILILVVLIPQSYGYGGGDKPDIRVCGDKLCSEIPGGRNAWEDKGMIPITIKNESSMTSLKSQIKNGVSTDSITCNKELVLIIRHNGSPACVKLQTAEKLEARSWGVMPPPCCKNMHQKVDVVINDIDDYFENIRNDTQKLEDFFSDMPKGGDLHNHLSGSTDTEDLIQIARDNNFCIDKSMKLNGTTPNCPSGFTSIDTVASEDILKIWSMYEFVSSPSETGHDHFFDTFGKFGALSEHKSQMLGYWMITAEKQNMLYMETMLNEGYASSKVESLADKIESYNVNHETFELLYGIIKPDIEKIASLSAKNITDLDNQSREFCKEKSKFECDIEFRYISQIHRTEKIHNVFVQAAMYFEIALQSEQVVGINIVSAEDSKIAMNDYDLHMKIIKFLHEKYKDVNISLHAGELSTALKGSNTTVKITASLMEKEAHIVLALGTGATRIGHGVDSPYEIIKYSELYSQMYNNFTAIEIPLTSNKVILQVEGEAHPIVEYMKNNVPVVLTTDDPGILRTTMTNEYVIAASDYTEFSYADFKKINRNTLEFSFLSGKSLWPESRTYENPLPQCSNDETNCWIKGEDQKATMQFMLEERLREFESTKIP